MALPAADSNNNLLPYSQVLGLFPTAERCVEVIEELHEAFSKENKQRKLDIELYLSVRIHPEDPYAAELAKELDANEGIYILRRAPKRHNTRTSNPLRKHDTFSLVARYDDPNRHQYQLDWARAAVTLALAPVKSVKR